MEELMNFHSSSGPRLRVRVNPCRRKRFCALSMVGALYVCHSGGCGHGRLRIFTDEHIVPPKPEETHWKFRHCNFLFACLIFPMLRRLWLPWLRVVRFQLCVYPPSTTAAAAVVFMSTPFISTYIYIHVDRQSLVLFTSVRSRWVNEGTAIARVRIPVRLHCTDLKYILVYKYAIYDLFFIVWKCRCSLPIYHLIMNTRRFSLLCVWLLIHCDHAEFHHQTTEHVKLWISILPTVGWFKRSLSDYWNCKTNWNLWCASELIRSIVLIGQTRVKIFVSQLIYIRVQVLN